MRPAESKILPLTTTDNIAEIFIDRKIANYSRGWYRKNKKSGRDLCNKRSQLFNY